MSRIDKMLCVYRLNRIADIVIPAHDAELLCMDVIPDKDDSE
jgi:hypothetical protein